MRGYIYILTNKSLKENYLKIGKTEREPETRAKELASTGVPDKYEVAYSQIFDNCHKIEKEIHRKLRPSRVKNDRESFAIPVQEAINIINSMALDELRNKMEQQTSEIKLLNQNLSLIKTKEWWATLDDEWKGFLLNNISLEGTDNRGNYTGIKPTTDDLIVIANLDEIICEDLPSDLNPMRFLQKIKRIKYEMGGDTPHKIASIVHEFPLLEDFIYRWTSLKNIDNFKFCKSLKYLNIDATLIRDLSPLANNHTITNLSVEQTCVEEVEELSKIPNIETLSISYNRIPDLSALNNLKKLKVLYFNGGETNSILPLSKHKSLQKIFLCDTSISDNQDIQNHEVKVFSILNPKCQIVTSWEEMYSNF